MEDLSKIYGILKNFLGSKDLFEIYGIFWDFWDLFMNFLRL